jgi:hypothetical protein
VRGREERAAGWEFAGVLGPDDGLEIVALDEAEHEGRLAEVIWGFKGGRHGSQPVLEIKHSPCCPYSCSQSNENEP